MPRRARQGTFVGAAFVEQWQARCPGGLVGATIEIDGLSATRTDVLVRIECLDGTTQTRAHAEQTSSTSGGARRRSRSPRTYFVLGVEHILLGVDHLLFVLGLLFLVGGWRRSWHRHRVHRRARSRWPAATLGSCRRRGAGRGDHRAEHHVRRRGDPARAPGACRPRGARALAGRVLFGLLHGFGFSGALREVGLPQQDIPLALLFFNVGVEVGQLLFIAVVVLALSVLTRLLRGPGHASRGPWRVEAMIRMPVAYAIGSVAAFWTVQRVAGFWA